MTGFGRAARRDRQSDIEVEARSVNHRFLSLKVSLPEPLARYEADVEQLVRSRVARGSVTITATMKLSDEEAALLPSPARVRNVYRSLQQMRRSLGLKGEVTFDTLLAVPGLFSPAAQESAEAARAWPAVKLLVAEAVKEMLRMRAREGATIRRDLLARLDTLGDLVRLIRKRSPAVLSSYQRRLEERIGALMTQKGLEVSPQDLLKEVAIYADRCDISEELQRLEAHVEGFRRIVRDGGQIGRRLDFLTQEMLRETNTLAAKGSDSEISAAAVEIKAELEKIKEQAENVE